MNYDVIVVGAGASGLVAAITAARNGSRVLVIEQSDKAGKKILATGNGKCNYTNLYQAPECYRSDDSAFPMKVLSCFDVQKTIDFFKELGIYPKERNGYLYPNSEQAASVVQVLVLECQRLKVDFSYGEKVTMVSKPDFTITTELYHENVNNRTDSKGNKTDSNSNKNKSKKFEIGKKPKHTSVEFKKYYGNHLILATGGCASPKLGSDGSGYILAEKFGHRIIQPLPALVQLKSSDRYCKTISGVRTNAKVEVFSNNCLIAEEEGELLFADYGISGIPILQISRYVAKALEKKKQVYLTFDFLPNWNQDELSLILTQRIHQNPHKTLEEMLIGLFNHKLNYIMIKEAGLNPYDKCEKISQKEIKLLVKQIKELRMNINGTNSFDHAQVSAGGVSTKEIVPETMESKQIKNLFFAGEIVDVDGTCGGYNLQWAWSSGYLAGETASGRK